MCCLSQAFGPLMAYLKGCSDGMREGTYPPAPFLRGKGSKVPLMASRSGCSDGVLRGDLSPGPFPTRKGE